MRFARNLSKSVEFLVPGENDRPWSPPEGYLCLYESFFTTSGLLFPLPWILIEYCARWGIVISQLTWASIRNFAVYLTLAAEHGMECNCDTFEAMTQLKWLKPSGRFYVSARPGCSCLDPNSTSGKCDNWEFKYFFVKIDAALVENPRWEIRAGWNVIISRLTTSISLSLSFWPEFFEQRIQRCREQITTSCFTLELAPLRPYIFPPIKPRKPHQKKERSMVKAKYKRINYSDVAEESPAPGKKTVTSETRTGVAVGKQTGASASAQEWSKHASSQAEKPSEVSLAAKKAGKRVADPPAKTVKKVPEKGFGKKIPSEVTVEGSKKKQHVAGSAQETVAEEATFVGSEENPTPYDLMFDFKSTDHIAIIPHACAELCSRIPHSMNYDFPEPESLIEKHAYQLFLGSVLEMITHGNLIIEKYDRKTRRLLKKLADYDVAKAEAAKVPELEKKIAGQITLMNDLSKQAEEVRQRRKIAEEELEFIKAKKESLQALHEKEMARLRASRRYEVNQIIAKCDAKFSWIKRLILDNEEAGRLNALMNQAMAIKDYLIGLQKDGTAVSDDQFKSLEENFERFEKAFEALDVEEVTDDDFKMTPPPLMSTNLPQNETAPASLNPHQLEIIALFDQYGTLMSAEQQAQDRIMHEGDLEKETVAGAKDLEAEAGEKEAAAVAKDAVTGEELGPLDGLPVIPSAQP
ncbi:unnamed protein product [Arabis nemorensis]|uniref:Uncharacterized protein n=1 Tax=Arabis nemorensis TaxID=586526 RepID=A0A565AN66_9BRAS|nr:unnamed protein product [Arabis nemorensis]